MCQMCDNAEEHPLRECEDAAVFIHGDPSARRLILEVWRVQTAVNEAIDRLSI